MRESLSEDEDVAALVVQSPLLAQTPSSAPPTARTRATPVLTPGDTPTSNALTPYMTPDSGASSAPRPPPVRCG